MVIPLQSNMDRNRCKKSDAISFTARPFSYLFVTPIGWFVRHTGRAPAKLTPHLLVKA